jgi:23S rRNA (adenine-N6)-dimethyltransferase
VHAATGRWGWHQLDAGWARRLVADSGVGRGDLVLDVGAGLGALTAPLLDTGARVVAVEAHPARAAALRTRFGRHVVVVVADAADLRLPRRPFHVVANPPFAVSSALLRRLVHPGSRLRDAHLVLQEPAARRWAGPDAPAAARWQRAFTPSLGPHLPRTAFRPPPSVGARVLVLRRHG